MKPKSDPKMGVVQTMQWLRAVCLAALSITVVFAALTARAFTSADVMLLKSDGQLLQRSV